MNILVTGGRGFVGRYIVKQLLEEGHTVINYNRDMQLPNEDPKNIFAFGEIYDVPRLMSVLNEYKVDRIIHTAAQSHPDVALEVPYATVEANVMGLMGVFEAARLTGIKRIVIFSTEIVYGNSDGSPIDESHVLNPTNVYAATKVADEMLARAYNLNFGLDIYSLRAGQMFGPGQVMQEYIRDAISSVVHGKKFILPEGRDLKFQLVHVTDAANAAVKACFATKKNENGAYNITSGYQPSFVDVMEMLKKLVPGAEFDVGPGDFGFDKNGIFIIEAAKRDLGYEPKVGLEEGLKEYIDWLKEHDY